ncbi:ribonucleotide reductase large subunit [Synechococcus phage S-CAM7]|uniref:Ribonucleoside-diphosphate reductase n=2 Tax=Synechococcus phage S-CAM7 TaxID=1883368 RepID=A0A1D8KTY5_9CAUD|nr:ribonucleotide reductase large subunit [Synechococcus phage S-CAM7]AOV62128.1 ribonucleotide reductase of class Ia (aerobic) alpha subunit [Synechococcus phage S-CAM7]
METIMNSDIKVIKRSGASEPLDINKLHVMVEAACEGLAGVSVSQVEMTSEIQFFDGITTDQIQRILVSSASNLIDLEHPNYQFVAARLMLFALRKQVYGKLHELITVKEQVERCVEAGVYDEEILSLYSDEEFAEFDRIIDHDRDYIFTFAGLRQVVDKYLVQDRTFDKMYETPQFMYLLVAATMFSRYPKATRMSYVKRYYDATSKHRINIPTPIMAGVRTPLRQYASCVLIDSDDSLDSIFSSDMAIGRYVAQRAGIGINAGRIRGLNSSIRGGEVSHTGVIPFLKKFEATVRCCTQNGIRGGSATVHFPIWHQEIHDIIVLKNNKGTSDNRVRKLDYSIQFSKIFYERFIQNGDITLFSPHDVPGLYEAFGTEDFDTLYRMYELNDMTPKKTVKAQELILELLKERAETGRIYIMNIDHCNSHSSFLDKVEMSNLCQEITLPTRPLDHIDSTEGEIALCILSAVNVGKLRNLEEMEELCDLAVRGLDELIDFQGYPIKAAEIATKNRRSLGIGYIGLAHYLAKHHANYADPEALQLVHDLTEHFQYYLIKATTNLAKEKGACGWSHRTKYHHGILPIDTYKSDVDGLVPNNLSLDWEALRADCIKYGVRNSTLSAQMPSESSSVVCNATNGIEPPRGYLSVKKSKKGPLTQIVPSYQTLKQYYTLLWDMKSNEGYINIVAVMQKFFDQAISGNWSYNPKNYPDGEVPVSVMVNDWLNTYKYGWKTSYYQNTYDTSNDGTEEAPKEETMEDILAEAEYSDDDDCDSCKI